MAQRSITAELETHFGQDVTTLALCFDITRRDGTVFGFTGHDVSIEYDGVTYDPFSSADVTNLEQLASTDADNLEIKLAFDEDYITKEDVQKGLYDYAEMRLFVINYADTSMGIVKLISGNLGESELTEYGATAEMVSLGAKLKTKVGRVYGYKCDAELGDTRCGVDLSSYTVTGSITSVTDRRQCTDSGRSEADDYFKYGQITFTSGANSGWTREIKSFASGAFGLLFPMPYDIEVGDTYEASAGCSNYPEDCKDKFDNFVNYRGFPHLPGRDEITKYPDAS